MLEPETVVESRPAPIEFGSYYYSHDCGPTAYGRTEEWFHVFNTLADRIVAELAPKRVLDVGCAIGLLVEALHQRGVDAWGIDVSDYAISQVDASVADRCFVAGVTDELPAPIPGDIDLVTCIEVVEHIPAEHGPAAIDRLAGLGDRVLFSSEPSDYAEATHVNVLPPEDWSVLFARSGMYRSIETDVRYLTPWAVLYERLDDRPHEVLRRYDRAVVRLGDEARQVRATALRLQAELAEYQESDAGKLRAELDATTARLETLEAERAEALHVLGSKTGRALQAYHAARAQLRRKQ
jgi:SAM-dependent methyltransferase